jgi:hypothetical protein
MRDDRTLGLGNFSGVLMSAVAGVVIAPAASAAVIDIPLNITGSNFGIPSPGGGLGLRYSTATSPGLFGTLQTNGVLNGAAMSFTPGPLLPSGQLIGGGRPFTTSEPVLRQGLQFVTGPGCKFACLRFTTTGLFTNPTSGFLGVDFAEHDGLHFGWLGVLAHPDTVQLTVTDLVFNDHPRTPVITGQRTDLAPPPPVPEPSSLSILAVGAAAVLAFRRRRQAAKLDVAPVA